MQSTRRSRRRFERRGLEYRACGLGPDEIADRFRTSTEAIEKILKKSGVDPTKGEAQLNQKLGLSQEEFRSRLLELVETAPSTNYKNAVVLKLEEELRGEENPEEQQKLKERIALSEEEFARRVWEEHDTKVRLLSDERGLQLIEDHAKKTGLSLPDAYREMLRVEPGVPRPRNYTDNVRPEAEVQA